MDRQSGSLHGHAPPTMISEQRFTKSGRQLRYEMKIVQEPVRARACGAGAKASADRRPVDPPPIVSMRIFDQLPAGGEHDITQTYNATFFVFVSLAGAERRLTQPRGMPDVNAIVKKEALAGSTVASGSPYDRPSPALYFIFPDLSVRHEGKYRFNFDLYELLKSSEDEDRNVMDMPAGPPREIIYRAQIQSAIFDVYSAKRFPGLSESTDLSRTLAEQGSRIRIRRDVRMRRRDTKGKSKEWDDYNDDDASARTPDAYARGMPQHQLDHMQRPTSSSSRTTGDLSRRPSLNDMQHSYLAQQQFAPSTAYPQHYQQQQQQQSFIHPPPPQYSAPTYQATQPPPQQQQQQQQPQQSYYAYSQQQQQPPAQQAYPPISTSFDPNPYQQRTSGDFSAMSVDSRRASMQSALGPSSATSYSQPSASSQHSYMAQTSPLYADSMAQQPLGHMQPLQQQTPTDPFGLRAADPLRPSSRVTTPNPNTKTNFPTKLPPLSTKFTNDTTSPSSVPSVSNLSNTTIHTPTDASNKRAYGSTFSTNWQNLPAKQGARPGDGVYSGNSLGLAADTDVDSATDSMPAYDRPVTYRRAGGGTATRTHV